MKAARKMPSVPTRPDGKGSVQQDVNAGQRATLAGGDVTSRLMNQYGKGHSFAPPSPASQAATPGMPAGAKSATVGAPAPAPYNPYAAGLGQ